MLLPELVMSNPTSSKPLLHIPYTYIMVTTFIFPVFSLISVVTLGVLLHFEKVTSTHCKVSHTTCNNGCRPHTIFNCSLVPRSIPNPNFSMFHATIEKQGGGWG